jgi:hypothetical protein
VYPDGAVGGSGVSPVVVRPRATPLWITSARPGALGCLAVRFIRADRFSSGRMARPAQVAISGSHSGSRRWQIRSDTGRHAWTIRPASLEHSATERPLPLYNSCRRPSGDHGVPGSQDRRPRHSAAAALTADARHRAGEPDLSRGIRCPHHEGESDVRQPDRGRRPVAAEPPGSRCPVACWQCHGTGGPEVAWVVIRPLDNRAPSRRSRRKPYRWPYSSALRPNGHYECREAAWLAATGRGNRACGSGLSFGAARRNSAGRHRIVSPAAER